MEGPSCSALTLMLMPFFTTASIYFYAAAYEVKYHGEAWSTILKCLPIFSLILFTTLLTPHKSKLAERRMIIIGLLLSSIGDIFLNLDCLKCGIIPFFIAHIFYIRSFGWKPLRPVVGAVLYLAGFFALSFFHSSLEADLKIGVPIYACALLTTCWRAIAQVHSSSCLSKYAAIGAVLFLISDAILSFDMFFTAIPNAQVMILLTYYGAQLGISMHAFSIREKSSHKSE